jgi:hypothetical protein
MGTPGAIQPSHKAVKAYYETLQRYAGQDVGHESALRSAFQNLLDELGRRMGWTLGAGLSETVNNVRCPVWSGTRRRLEWAFLGSRPPADL